LLLNGDNGNANKLEITLHVQYMAGPVVYGKEHSVYTIQKATCQEIASPGFKHFVNVSLFMEPEIPTRHGLLLYFRNNQVSIRRSVVTVGLIAMT
jgi:hypothetical protein